MRGCQYPEMAEHSYQTSVLKELDDGDVEHIDVIVYITVFRENGQWLRSPAEVTRIGDTRQEYDIFLPKLTMERLADEALEDYEDYWS